MSEQMGWWRHPSHVRKCSEAVRFNFQAAVKKGAQIHRARERHTKLLKAFSVSASFLAGVLFVIAYFLMGR